MTPDTAMAQVDAYIYRMRASTGNDPASLTLTKDQAEALEKWAAGRSQWQDKVVLTPGGKIWKYRSISVKVKGG